jgi:hypothetical protein
VTAFPQMLVGALVYLPDDICHNNCPAHWTWSLQLSASTFAAALSRRRDLPQLCEVSPVTGQGRRVVSWEAVALATRNVSPAPWPRPESLSDAGACLPHRRVCSSLLKVARHSILSIWDWASAKRANACIFRAARQRVTENVRVESRGTRQTLGDAHLPAAPCPTACATIYCHMAQRDKRSVSFPPDLAKAIDEAVAASGTSFSAWIAETASHRLRLEAGRQGVAEWEAEHGPLSERELAEGLARVRTLLGRKPSKRSA